MVIGPPPIIGGFGWIRHLGSGGFADVHLYKELWLDRLVAIKVLSGQLSETTITAFTDEANRMARLSNHPAIVTVYRAGISDDARPYLVMEYCSQPNLESRYRQSVFSEAETLAIGIEIAGAIETVHRAGILHRDIKPANILVTDYHRNALADFGIAATIGTTTTGLSVPWAPPEAFNPDTVTDERSDVYSLAATLYTLLTGRTPYELAGQSNTTTDLINRIQTSPPQPLNRPGITTELQQTLTTAMAKNPADRPQTAAELGRQLQRIQIQHNIPQTRLEIQNQHHTHQPHINTNTQIHNPNPQGTAGSMITGAPLAADAQGGHPSGSLSSGSQATAPSTGTGSIPPSSSGTAPAGPVQSGRHLSSETILKPAALAASPSSAPGRTNRRTVVLTAVITVLAIAIGGALTWLLWPDRKDSGTAGSPTSENPAASNSETPTPKADEGPQKRLNLPVGRPLAAGELLIGRYKTLTAPGRLWLVNTEDPSASKSIEAAQPGTAFGFSLSPDRRTITYIVSGREMRAVATSGGSGRRLFVAPDDCKHFSHASWSPTDLSIFVLECRLSSGKRRLMVTDLDGNVIRKLDTDKLSAIEPTISPDGTKVAFVGYTAKPKTEGGSIYVMPVDGSSKPTAITKSKADRDSDPSWSPDGNSIAFRRRVGPRKVERPNETRFENIDILVVGADGGKARKIVTGPATDDRPTWSPDGQTLAFVSNRAADGSRTDQKSLWLVSAEGGLPTPLGLKSARFGTPTWWHR